jgi:asparaginyl-tRNA synthetase
MRDNDLYKRINDDILQLQTMRSVVLTATIDYFSKNKFMLIDPPILHEPINNKKEIIKLNLNEDPYNLNMSNALYMSTYAMLFDRVFAISPTFRNERQSNTHLFEFRMLECEAVNIGFSGCIDIIKSYIKYIIDELLKLEFTQNVASRLEVLKGNLSYETISYKDLIFQLNHKGTSIEYGNDLSDSDFEISKFLKKPTFVVDYPCPPATWTALPKNPLESRETYTFNLLLPDGFGELAEGGQRNNDYHVFERKFESAKIDSLQWYKESIRKNPVIRSGFGLGIDRLVCWLSGTVDIRDVVLFYRGVN